MVKVLCQLIAVVIVGEKALEKCQQLRENKNSEKVKSVTKTDEEDGECLGEEEERLEKWRNHR